MSDSVMRDRRAWSINKSISLIDLVVATAMLLTVLVYVEDRFDAISDDVSSNSARVTVLEAWSKQSDEQDKRMEARITARLDRIESKLDRAIEVRQ